MDEVSRQHEERLQRTSRLITMGEMASTLAHELNQPLSAIANYCMGCVRRLIGRLPPGGPRRDAKGPCQAERAGKIIRRLRDFVKKSEPRRAPVSIAELIDDALGFADIDARKAVVRIT